MICIICDICGINGRTVGGKIYIIPAKIPGRIMVARRIYRNIISVEGKFMDLGGL